MSQKIFFWVGFVLFFTVGCTNSFQASETANSSSEELSLFFSSSVNLTLAEGDNLVIAAGFAGDGSIISFDWEKQNVDQSWSSLGVNSQTLVIAPLSANDSGNYRILAVYDIKKRNRTLRRTAYSEALQVTVFAQPSPDPIPNPDPNPTPNQAPLANDDSQNTLEDQAVMIDVLANDSDPDGDSLQLIQAMKPTGGMVSINSGMIQFTPDANFNGSTNFNYTISDGQLMATGSVSINVTPVNDAPVAVNDSFQVMENATLNESGILSNDYDVDNEPFSISMFTQNSAQGGQVNVQADGSFTFIPATDFSGMDSFSYSIIDGNGGTSTGQVQIEVMADTSNNSGGGGSNPPPPPQDTQGLLFTAAQNGDWFDANTWDRNQVPGNGANVLIPMGITIQYSGVSTARLYKVEAMGTLEFDPNADSTMVVDTLWFHNSSLLRIGTQSQPVRGDRLIQIIFTSDQDILLSDYPELKGRGIMMMGDLEVHGEKKTVHMKVSLDPKIGDTMLTMQSSPQNWKVGDTLVVAGTHYKGYSWDNNIRATRHYLPEDDVVKIAAVNGNQLTLDRPLTFDHSSPRADLKTSVANYTRNVRFVSEDGALTPVHRRAHLMMMGDGNYNLRFAEFFEMGRTDKTRLAFDTHSIAPSSSMDNVKARYPVHFHFSNLGNVQNPGVVIGCAVFGSPGWGYVHHASNAFFHNNASYNTHGAGFSAETGDEIGSWTHNIAIYAKGNNWAEPKNSFTNEEFANFDLGKTGDGFWFQGRMVEARHNIAASVNNGFAYFHRGNGTRNFVASLFDFPEAFKFSDSVTIDDAPIIAFDHNEVFAANKGFHVTKANTNQGHDVHSQLTNFTAWSVMTGMEIKYTAHYILRNIDVIGKRPESFQSPRVGIFLGTNTTNVSIIGASIENFQDGIDLEKDTTFPISPIDIAYNVVDAQFSNVTNQLVNYDSNADVVTTSAALPQRNFNIVYDTPLVMTPIDGYGSTQHPGVTLRGRKTDGLGNIKFPAAVDNFNWVSYYGLNNYLQTEGYRTANGLKYVVLETYHTDRLTGEVHKLANIAEIDPNLGTSSFINAGPIDFNSRPPLPNNDATTTTMDQPVRFDIVSNDQDPDGDNLKVDGIVQPVNGKVYDNGDGTVTYVPDFDYQGQDSFKYWVTDNQGHYIPAMVTVNVQ